MDGDDLHSENTRFVIVAVFDNYVPAHIARGRLEEEGINCWLQDENTVTIDPILSQAIGGIKLMVPATQSERAADILGLVRNKFFAKNACPSCGSTNVEMVSSPRKLSNWLGALIGYFAINYAVPVEKDFHCFNCGNEWKGEPTPETPEKNK
jgi:predicted RNA-binding Zn-ribbon protein involved in translation (DUF1610 family)